MQYVFVGIKGLEKKSWKHPTCKLANLHAHFLTTCKVSWESWEETWPEVFHVDVLSFANGVIGGLFFIRITKNSLCVIRHPLKQIPCLVVVTASKNIFVGLAIVVTVDGRIIDVYTII